MYLTAGLILADNTESAVDIAQDILKTYIDTYENNWLTGMRAKCGLTPSVDNDTDKSLIEELLGTMAKNNADFTLTFFHLSRLDKQTTAEPSKHNSTLRELFDDPGQLDDWLTKWQNRLNTETLNDKSRQTNMQAINPVYIPRNHQIEAAIRAAEDHNDFSVFHALHEILQHPYTQQEDKERYQLPPEPDEVVTQTFCGT